MQLIEINKAKNFQHSFGHLKDWDKLQVLFILATCSNCSITIYVKIPLFRFFEKANKVQLKMININY